MLEREREREKKKREISLALGDYERMEETKVQIE